jgi:glycosyltransferase involved in cell wall biosynthesis
MISVVTPFYNTAPYLGACIESVLAQTFTDFEYILVNNRSTDGADAIARRYAALDSRIRVVDNERFVSQVQNYNGALRQVSRGSRYCKVVQADDWLHPDCLRSMAEVAERNPRVALVSAYNMLGDDVYLTGLPVRQEVFAGRDVCRLFFLRNVYVFGSPTAVMMRSDVVRARHDFYRTDCPFEDADIGFQLLQDNDFAFVHQVLTYTRRDHESLMTKIETYHSGLLTRLLMLRRYGHAFLDDAEYAACWREVSGRYRRKLGESAVRLREADFWQFQRTALASEGLTLNQLSIAGHAALYVLSVLLNPLQSTQRVFERATRATRIVTF